MPGVGGGETLAEKYMAQVAAAVRALDFYSHTVWVGQLGYRSRYFLVEGGPTATGVELVHRAIQLGVAASAEVNALFVQVVVVLAGKGRLGTLEFDYVAFLAAIPSWL